MVFGIIPECRSASFRNERSASPESPGAGLSRADDQPAADDPTKTPGIPARAYGERSRFERIVRVPNAQGILEAAIREYIAVHNEDPKPFVWTRTADQILDSIARYAQRTAEVQPR